MAQKFCDGPPNSGLARYFLDGAPVQSFPRLMNDWQYQRRWMLFVVQYCVCGGNKPACVLDFLASVQIAIKAREIAAGDL